MVIFNHSNERGFSRYVLDEVNSWVWVWDTFLSTMCKVGVPLFFMISGANLIGKEETFKKTFKRSVRIILCLCIWSFLYFYIDAFASGNEFIIMDSLRRLVSGYYWHLWYLYAYIALLFTLPLLRQLAKNMESNEFHLLLGLGVILALLLPIVECFVIPVFESLKPTWIISDIFLFPVVGYYVDKKINIIDISKRFIIIIWCINIAVFTVGEICERYYLLRNPGDGSETFLRTGCLINAIVIFVSVKYFYCNATISGRVRDVIPALGKMTFGIYLMHIILLWKVPVLLSVWYSIEGIGRFGIHVVTILVFAIAYIVTTVLKRIPIIRGLV